MAENSSNSSWLRPSLDGLLVFVPVAIALRFIPGLENQTWIALFVAPILIFASYFFGRPMNLEFTIPEVVAVFGSIIIVEQICSDGESNWVEGVQLLSVYMLLGILFYFLSDAHQAASETINSVAPQH